MRGKHTGRGPSVKLGTQEFGHVGQDRSSRLKAEDLARRGPSGLYGSVTPPSKEAIRRSVEAGICPICGRGPYKVVSVHTNKKHGVDKYELRDMAGMSTADPTCLPEFSAGARERAKRHDRDMAALARVPRTKERRRTAAGRERNVRTLTEWVEAHPDYAEWCRQRAAEVGKRPEAKEKWRAAMAARPLQPCGTRASYRRGCRCGACTEASRAYNRSRKNTNPEENRNV